VDVAIQGLSIIGERINPGYKSSKVLLDEHDIEGIQDLAKSQVEKGAVALNLNVGEGSEPEYFAEVIRAVQSVVSVPLSFDSPDPAIQEVCLKAYDADLANGAWPIMNSVTELRWEMMDLLAIRPFKVVLMASERDDGGSREPNRTPEDVYRTAARMTERVLRETNDLTIDDLIIDVSLGPVAADTEGLTRTAIDAVEMIGKDPALAGIHMSVGLSNISIMLPARATDGKLLKTRIESAFLTMGVPLGLDMVIGTAGRKYRMLPDDDLVMVGLREALQMGTFESIIRIQELYAGVAA
jgi:cobalamin-dependent methionine synthase I